MDLKEKALQAKEAKKQAMLSPIKAVYDDKEMIINGRTYVFTKTNHATRLKIFAFFSQIQQEISEHNFAFLGRPEWPKIEREIFRVITHDDMSMDKLDGYFNDEEHASDYLKFIVTAMGVISYPFL